MASFKKSKQPLKTQVRDGGIMLIILSFPVFYIFDITMGWAMFGLGFLMVLAGQFSE